MALVYRLVKGSRLTHAELDGNFEDLDDRLVLITPKLLTASFPGAGAVTTGKPRWYPPSNITLQSMYVTAGVAPTADGVFTLKKNGSSIATNTLSNGSSKSSATTLTTTLTPSDYLTVDITSITGGEAFTVLISYTVTP